MPANRSLFKRSHSRSFHALTRPLLPALTAITLAALVAAPAVQAKRAAPTVAQIIDDYVVATGGKAAYEKIKSSKSSGTLEIVAAKIKGEILIEQKAPDKFYSSQTITGLGKLEQGYDGKTAWSRDPINGARILAGSELAQSQLQAQFNAILHWKQQFPKSELLGERMVGGAKTYAIRLTPAKGHPTTQFYDIKTKLMVRQDQTADSPQGEVPGETYPSDYRAVDGVKVPFTTRVVQGGAGELLLKLTEVKNNVALPDSAFAVPADILPAPAK